MKEGTKQAIEVEEAKEMDLDEQARPTKKAGRAPLPSPEFKIAHKKLKGTRKAR